MTFMFAVCGPLVSPKLPGSQREFQTLHGQVPREKER